MADSYRPTPVRLQQNGSSCGEGGLEVVGREQVRGGVSGSERISLADCAVEGETAHAPGGSPALLPTPPTPPPLGLAEPGRSDGCGGLEWLGVAFAVPQKRGASGRGLRCPPSRWNGWAWPSLSPPISVARVGVACAVSRHVGAGGRGLFCLWAWTSLFIFGAKARRRGLPGTTVRSGWAWPELIVINHGVGAWYSRWAWPALFVLGAIAGGRGLKRVGWSWSGWAWLRCL